MTPLGEAVGSESGYTVISDPTLTVIFLLQLQTDYLAALGDAEV
jgi:hypothetical protein